MVGASSEIVRGFVHGDHLLRGSSQRWRQSGSQPIRDFARLTFGRGDFDTGEISFSELLPDFASRPVCEMIGWARPEPPVTSPLPTC